MSIAQPDIALLAADGVVSQSIPRVLAPEGINVVAFANDRELLTALEDQHFECLLLDLQQTGTGRAILQRVLVERKVAMPVIALAGHADVTTAVQAMKAGALDVIEMPFAHERLLESVRHAVELYSKWHRNLEQRRLAHERIGRLTAREMQVLDLMTSGKPNRDIAAELGISPKTLDIHRANVMHKMAARTTADLVRMRILDRTDPLGVGYLGN
jgi:two-component system, LuxR family, response regulator FixJ